MPSFSELVRSRRFWLIAGPVIAIGVVIIIVLVNGSGQAAPAPTTTSTTTTVAETTTTTAPPTTTTTTRSSAGEVSPLNGLPVDDPELLDRRLLAVKIDNHPNARPHSGIESADAVIELMVEGVTRFISLWQQSDSEYLGPMRSGRPTEQTLLPAFNEPTLAISGAQGWVQQMIRSVGVHIIGEVGPATFRVSTRRSPHNLYTNTILLREQADSLGYPDEPMEGPMWEFGPMPDDAAPVGSIRMDFSGNIVDWVWDEETATWLRSTDGEESYWETEEEETERLGFPVLVALYVEQYFVGGLPSSRTGGTGQAYVFADGKVVEGEWQRDEITEWFTLTDGDGEIILVPPGQVWISLIPDTSGLTYE